MKMTRMLHRFLPTSGLVLLAAITSAHPPQEAPPARTAAPSRNNAFLHYHVTDQDGNGIPVRLTFIADGLDKPDLFPGVDASPNELAMRQNIIYTIDGDGTITVPPGHYTVHASRGMEWSIASAEIVLEPGRTTRLDLQLTHEVDTTGWIGGDYHLHTLTYSGHGDSNMPERIISIVGEGLDFAVATDHNHNTDYDPIIREVGAETMLRAVVGNEVSVPIGHFNIFPLSAEDRVFPTRLDNARILFSMARKAGNPYDIVPVIQVNHPRWNGIDYFALGDLDPTTGVSTSDRWSDDFDCIEILNENVCWGLYDVDAEPGFDTSSSRHWALMDWYNLLNRGSRAAAVGNSDSHTVRSPYAGVPRNYTPSSTDDPGSIDPVEVAEAIKRGEVFTTTGPFVRMTVNGQPMGSTIDGSSGKVDVELVVDAARWIDVDRARLIFNGNQVGEIPIDPADSVRRLDTTMKLPVRQDGWLTVIVEGDDPMTPVFEPKERDVLPLAITNPVFVDFDGDGTMSPLQDQADRRIEELIASGGQDQIDRDWKQSDPMTRRALLIAACNDQDCPADLRNRILELGLNSDDHWIEHAALRMILREPGRKHEDSLVSRLNQIALVDDSNMTNSGLAMRALIRSGDGDSTGPIEWAMEYSRRHGPDALSRLGPELVEETGRSCPDHWLVAGYFPRVDEAHAGSMDLPRHGPIDMEAEFDVRGGIRGWHGVRPSGPGYLDLFALAADPSDSEQAACVARAWVESPGPRRIIYAFGSDDGAQLFINGELLHEDTGTHGAAPYQVVGTTNLASGLNPITVVVENGTGSFGFYFAILDEDLEFIDHEKLPAITGNQ